MGYITNGEVDFGKALKVDLRSFMFIFTIATDYEIGYRPNPNNIERYLISRGLKEELIKLLTNKIIF